MHIKRAAAVAVLCAGVAARAHAVPIALSSDFALDYSASQSLWQGGPSFGLDSSGRTSGSVGAYYSVQADTGTVNATQNGTLRASYSSETVAGNATNIALQFVGDSMGGFVESRFGASAEAGVFVDISGCLGVTTPLGCAGIPYDINQDIALISEGLFLNPNSTHTPVIDTMRSASDAALAVGVGGLDVVIGTIGATMNLDLTQNIDFTPTGLTGMATYRNVDTGETGTSAFSIPTSGAATLSLDLAPGTWDVSFADVMLSNSFHNRIDLGLRPAVDYIVGSWPPVGHDLLSFALLNQTFGLSFNEIQDAGTIRVSVVEGQGTTAVPEPGTLALCGLGLLSLVFVRRGRAAEPSRRRAYF